MFNASQPDAVELKCLPKKTIGLFATLKPLTCWHVQSRLFGAAWQMALSPGPSGLVASPAGRFRKSWMSSTTPRTRGPAMTSPKKDSGMVARDDAERREFSSYKFNLIDAFTMDSTLTALQRLVGIRLTQRLNCRTRTCYPSAQTLADELGVCVRSIEKAIAALKRRRWIEVVSKGRHGTNVYRVLETHLNAVLDYQTSLRDARIEDRRRPNENSGRVAACTEPQFGTEPKPISDKHLN
jgi:hypothetical protein